jgi:hypothetical protein
VSLNVFLPPSSKFLLFSESVLRFSKTVGGNQSKLSNLEREERKKRESQNQVRERTRKRERERESERRTRRRRRRGFRNPKTFFERLPYDDHDSGVSESSGNQSVSKTSAADLLSQSQQIRFADQKKLLSEEEASAKQKTRKVVPAAAAAAASACVGFFWKLLL